MELFVILGTALGLGLLTGLQRERTDGRFGGIRTFPLISLFGAFCGLLARTLGAAPVAVGLVAVFGTLALAKWLKDPEELGDHGQTTEMAALLTFAIGAYLPLGDRALAVTATGLLVILLHLKEPMHVFVRKMGPKDMTGLMQFVVVSMIILPLLPNRGFGPWQVLNPFDIWRMVVLIIGLSLTGYISYKFFGNAAGTLLGGVLGGLISSTATAISYSRRARAAPGAHRVAVAVILIASAVSILRFNVEVSVIAPNRVGTMLPPLLAMFAWAGLLAGAAFFLFRDQAEAMPEPGNPAEFKSALIFGLIYALITLVSAAVKDRFGANGLYGVAVVSGLTDMDAITLSLARMAEKNQIEPASAWRLILTAALANLGFKASVAAALGGWRFAARIAPFFGAVFAGGIVLILLWPR